MYQSKNKQKGFTLIEILVALAILSVIALLASSAFDGSRSKAQSMIGLAKQIGDGNIQLKTDTGCYVNNPSALFEPTAAQLPANNYCASTFGGTWARPYLQQYTTNAVGDLVIDKISAGVTVGLKQLVDANGTRYYVHLENVPMDVIKQALVECNNDNKTPGDFLQNRCRTTSDLSTTQPGTFDMLYDTTM